MHGPYLDLQFNAEHVQIDPAQIILGIMQRVYRSADKHLHVHIITMLGYYIQR